eukprot:9756289-Prorocentrum_lima.AAC.1
MTSSLVGSEMCIRDSAVATVSTAPPPGGQIRQEEPQCLKRGRRGEHRICLLYTSDAADDM